MYSEVDRARPKFFFGGKLKRDLNAFFVIPALAQIKVGFIIKYSKEANKKDKQKGDSRHS